MRETFWKNLAICDGSSLMYMGAMGVIGAKAPKNLVHHVKVGAGWD